MLAVLAVLEVWLTFSVGLPAVLVEPRAVRAVQEVLLISSVALQVVLVLVLGPTLQPPEAMLLAARLQAQSLQRALSLPLLLPRRVLASL